MGERRYGCFTGDGAARAPQRNIYVPSTCRYPALPGAGLARYDRAGSRLTEGMGRNWVGILLSGLVSALLSPLRFPLRGSGAGIQIPSRQ